MSAPNLTSDQNLLPVQAYFDVFGNFQTFIGQGQPFYATVNPSQSGLNITNSTINSTTIGLVTPSTGIFTNIQTTTGSISTTAVNPTDLVNKSYVDAVAQGLAFKQPAQVATLANITLSGLQTIDGYTTLVGDRVLVKNQTTQANNGIYVASASTWVRSSDANTYAELVSAFLFIENGSAQSGSAWVCTIPQSGTLGTTPITFSQFSNSATYTAGTGLTLSSYQFSITPVGTSGTYGSASSVPVFVTNASGQVTSVTNTSIAISNTQVSGLGTMSTQNANNVAITGGSIIGTPISGSTVGGTTITASTQFSGPGTGLTGTATSLNIGGNASTATTATTATTANTATTATNLGGGLAGYLPYQTSANTTTFLSPSTNGYYLTLSSGLPSWTALPSNVSSFSAGTTGFTPSTATTGAVTLSGTLSITNGGTGNTTGQATSVANALTFNNSGSGVVSGSTYNGSSATTVSYNSIGASPLIGSTSLTTLGAVTTGTWNASLIGLAYGGTNANLTANAGGIVYSGASALAISTAGTTGQYLTSNGTGAPTWSTPSASVTISDQTVSSSTFYPAFLSATSGTATTIDTSSTKLQYVPSTGTFTATVLNAGNHVATGSITGSANTGAFSYGTLGYSDTNILASFQSSVNTYNQMVLQNTSSGATASTNFNVSNNNATSNTNFGEFGINSSGFTGTGAFSAAGYVYLASASTDLAIGTYGSNSIHFVTNSSATDAITINTSNAVAFNGSYGTSGYLLQSNGSGSAPTWVSTPSGTTITDDTTTNATKYPLFSSVTSGTLSTVYTSSTEFQYNPSTGTLISPILQAGTGANYIQSSGNTTGNAPVVQALGSDTNISLVLQPKGTGALQAQQTTSTATGGNARGANAVDWQTSRGGASQVASGSLSTLGGGSTNTASGYNSTVTGGSSNIASTNYAFVGGGTNNTASGFGHSTTVAGYTNTAAGYLNFIGGGSNNSGTAQASVTTQATTTVTSGSTAVTLSGSNASIKVGQLITGTGIVQYTYVSAISGTSLTLSQNANASGSPTLSFYTPHGVVVGGGNNQATGSYSFVGGGGDAGTSSQRNVASGDWSFVGGGWGNQATAVGAVVVGGGQNNGLSFGNSASNTSAFVGAGVGNQASGSRSSVVGGYSNYANADYAAILGGIFGNARSIIGNQVAAACNNPMGTASLGTQQFALLILARQTTDATATVLTSNTSAASSTNQVILPNNSAYSFRATIIAGVTGGGNTASWVLQGAIKRGANAASTAIVSTVTSILLAQDSGASTWAVSATADTTNGGLAITVTGQASTTIRWVCKVETTEMTY